MRSAIKWVLVLVGLMAGAPAVAAEPSPFKLKWKDNLLTVSGQDLPGGDLAIWYLEAYCRPGSTDRDWGQTVIGHKTELISASDDGQRIRLKCLLKDGVVVEHDIQAVSDGVQFRVVAKNPTDKESEAHWAQPCIRVGNFTGRKQTDYLDKCFVFLDGKLERLPTRDWATKARYTPGQVWAPKSVNRNDVNPRPLSPLVPSNGLIGCFSADESWIMASAWEPYQELFQGVIVCVHSDFRIGGLKPSESKTIRGKVYLLKGGVEDLVKRYEADFPEQRTRSSSNASATR